MLLSEKTTNRIIDLLCSPSTLVLVGLLLMALAYTLYPFRKESIIPGVFIGIGIVGLTWIVYKVVHAGK